jgi:acetyl-CoA carboxylase biotin carboxyl carrier protein
VEFNLSQVGELLGLFNQTQVAELNLKSGDFELTLRKGDRVVMTAVPPIADSLLTNELPPETPPPPPGKPTPPPGSKKLVDILSPMVGTFYRASAPDESPFVEVGESIRRGQTVCIIEAMKLMNEIEAEVNGQVVEILVQNGEPVEYGQALLRVNPG